MLKETPICDFTRKAPDFSLPDTNGKYYSLNDIKGKKGTILAFICNHCPYVKAIITRMVSDFATLKQHDIGAAAIMSNNWRQYPDDAPDKMAEFATKHQFHFPYLIDETQTVARDYQAICTPDFFGFNAELGLQYRGRLDNASAKTDAQSPEKELISAMMMIAETGTGPTKQTPSMGCSIKWR